MGNQGMRGEILHYILEGTEPVPIDCSTSEGLDRWGEWFEDISNRKLFKTEINGVRISTVFLGIDHNWSGIGQPILFETMIFKGSSCEDYMERYCTYDQAHAGHILACAMVGSNRVPRKLKKKLKKWSNQF